MHTTVKNQSKAHSPNSNLYARPFPTSRSPAWRFWSGAGLGVLISGSALTLVMGASIFRNPNPLTSFAGALALPAACLLGGWLLSAALAAILRFTRRIPALYRWALCTWLLQQIPLLLGAPIGVTGLGWSWLALLVISSLAGGGSWMLASGLPSLANNSLPRSARLPPAAALLFGLAGIWSGASFLFTRPEPPAAPLNAALLSPVSTNPLDLPNPSQPGSYPVHHLTYGSGTDRQRPEYAAQAALHTGSVDGSAFLTGWSDLRTSYWGFGPQSMPLNGRVTYPEGPGPFPLVVIVHGNHPMEESSEPGYAYLEKLFASHGMITATIDENFLNTSTTADLLLFSPLLYESAARAWLVLEHLQVWRSWNGDPASPFYRKVDLERIALVGHSRGGEAVTLAAAFNRLPASPDDARIPFDYNFNIRAVAALAPLSGRYLPDEQLPVLEDISYLTLHGAQDLEVPTFMGALDYQDVKLTGATPAFKAAIYLYGANHNGFNTVWASHASPPPWSWVLNGVNVLPTSEQTQIAQIYIGAFLQTTLLDQGGYQALFRDARLGAAWLPQTIYLSQYQDSTIQVVSSFEEDNDPVTAGLASATWHGQGLSEWQELQPPVKLGYPGQQIDHRVVSLRWQAGSSPASFSLALPDHSLPDLGGASLVFDLADARPAKMAGQPVDLTIAVIDRDGNTARQPLSSFSLLQPALRGHLTKNDLYWAYLPDSEPVFQTFTFPLAAFNSANPAFDPARLAGVSFTFDRTPAGSILLDNLGFVPGSP